MILRLIRVGSAKTLTEGSTGFIPEDTSPRPYMPL